MARAKVQTSDFDPEQLMDGLASAWDRLEMEVESMTNTDAVGDDEVDACSSEKVPMGFHQPKPKSSSNEDEDDEDEDFEIDTTVICRKDSNRRTKPRKASKE